MHFNTTMMKDIGKGFCETLVTYQKDQESVQRVMNELKIRYPQGGTSGAPGADFILTPVSKDTPASPTTQTTGAAPEE